MARFDTALPGQVGFLKKALCLDGSAGIFYNRRQVASRVAYWRPASPTVAHVISSA